MQYAKFIITILSFCSIAIISCHHGFDYTSGPDGAKIKMLRKKIKHVIVIYQENWSFDGLYGYYPDKRVNNLLRGNYNIQVSRKGIPLDSFPVLPLIEKKFVYKDNKITVDTIDYRFVNLNKLHPGAVPYNLNEFVRSDVDTVTGDLVHRYYTEILQIDHSKMDKFVAWSDNGGLVMSYYNDTTLPEVRLASHYTLCDNFFHSAFGGSFLNHIWFVAAATPEWKSGPFSMRSDVSSDKLKSYDKALSSDGYAINTIYSVNHPHPLAPDSVLLPPLKLPTIGDRLTDAGQSWAWYSGGWNAALAGNNSQGYFQYHHQPFVYFENYNDGTYNKKYHLKDETEFFTSLNSDYLPAVCFIKPLGINNEHPGYANLLRGEQHVDSIVHAVMNSKYWESSVIIITYDEHGGRYDHVAPPVIDRWGPGTRVPTIVISPFAKRNFVDSTQYETVSILKLIETLYGLPPLSKRDSLANNMLNTFEL